MQTRRSLMLVGYRGMPWMVQLFSIWQQQSPGKLLNNEFCASTRAFSTPKKQIGFLAGAFIPTFCIFYLPVSFGKDNFPVDKIFLERL